jgi:hypothetical protein
MYVIYGIDVALANYVANVARSFKLIDGTKIK